MNTYGSFKLVQITTVPMTLGFFTGHVRYMKERGVETEAISSPGPELDRFAGLTGIACHPIPIDRRLAPANDVISLFRLYRLLKELRPDIVHSHTPKAGLLGTLAARMAGVKCRVLSVFGLPQMTKSGALKTLLDMTTRLSCKCADLVWCDSPSMREYMIHQHLCRAGKVVVLGHGSVGGVDAARKFNPDTYGEEVRREIRFRYGIPEGAPVIGFIGRVVADKGMNEFAHVWRILRKEFPEMHLLLVGIFEPSDPLKRENEEMLRNDPRVHLTGWCHDIPQHLSILDLLINPSYREGFGVVHLEAAAMGIPVLATQIPGCIDSVQDGVTGILVPPRDVTALENALRRYVGDASLRLRHGTAGRIRVQNLFRPESISEALLTTYRRLLAKHRGPGYC
ncbi:MAG TPA: glycosyltransferase family 4 protein [Candidatus Ozemobacteraceae bacterium]|nr:glycosyltransferase family 4 protein [Candidatus Ozemobacteraceae bacterium]